jgi:hypothetical protein
MNCHVFTVPAILSEAMPATSHRVQSEIDTTLEMAYKFTGTFGHLHLIIINWFLAV